MSTRAPETPALFTRKATGLVREARGTDALFYNVMWASVALSFAFFWLFYGFAYQGSNAAIAFLIAAALGRPGRVHVRDARADHAAHRRRLRVQQPLAAPGARLRRQLQLLLLAGDHLRRLHDLPGRLRLRRLRAHDGRLHRLGRVARLRRLVLDRARPVHHRHGRACCSRRSVFIVGGLRLFLRLQVGAFALYMLGAFLLPILAGLFQSRTGFLANFNDYAANLGQDNAAGALAASAKKAGFAPTGFDTRGDAQVGDGVLVHLRLPLLEQLLRRRDPDCASAPTSWRSRERCSWRRSRSR